MFLYPCKQLEYGVDVEVRFACDVRSVVSGLAFYYLDSGAVDRDG